MQPDLMGHKEVRRFGRGREGPARLSGTELLRVANVRGVFVVRPDQDGVLGPLQPVPPLLQGRVFSVPHIVVLLGRGESSGEEGDRVNLLVPLSMLGQDGSDAHVRRIHLNDELSVGVGEDEHRSCGEEGLEGDESGLCLSSPGGGGWR